MYHKQSLRLPSLVLILSSALLGSCAKEISKEDFESILTTQNWQVTDLSLIYYNSDGSIDYMRTVSYTTEYTDHRFQFHTDGKILVTKDVDVWNGTWTITQDKKKKHSILNLEFSDSTWSDYFTGKWQLSASENEETPEHAKFHFSGQSNFANTLAIVAVQ